MTMMKAFCLAAWLLPCSHAVFQWQLLASRAECASSPARTSAQSFCPELLPRAWHLHFTRWATAAPSKSTPVSIAWLQAPKSLVSGRPYSGGGGTAAAGPGAPAAAQPAFPDWALENFTSYFLDEWREKKPGMEVDVKQVERGGLPAWVRGGGE